MKQQDTATLPSTGQTPPPGQSSVEAGCEEEPEAAPPGGRGRDWPHLSFD